VSVLFRPIFVESPTPDVVGVGRPGLEPWRPGLVRTGSPSPRPEACEQLEPVARPRKRVRRRAGGCAPWSSVSCGKSRISAPGAPKTTACDGVEERASGQQIVLRGKTAGALQN